MNNILQYIKADITMKAFLSRDFGDNKCLLLTLTIFEYQFHTPAATGGVTGGEDGPKLHFTPDFTEQSTL